MAANLDSIGIQSWTAPLGAVCDSLDYEKRVDEVIIPNCTSGFGLGETIDPIIDFSIKGYGDLPTGFVAGGNGGGEADITGVNDGAGTIIIESVKQAEKNDMYNAFEISGTYFPGVV